MDMHDITIEESSSGAQHRHFQSAPACPLCHIHFQLVPRAHHCGPITWMRSWSEVTEGSAAMMALGVPRN